MLKAKPYIELARFDKPVGIFLLAFPCFFGLALAESSFIFYILFFLGAVIMRSAGCVINDFFDKEFDKKVARTKDRPIASAKISPESALIFFAILCGVAALILFQFNKLTIIIGLVALLMLIIYPLTKRFISVPQKFLGLTINIGVLMGYASVKDDISFVAILLYLSCYCWTIIYDTIYAHQDKYDDSIIGINSSALKYGKKTQQILLYYFFFMSLMLNITGYFIDNITYFIFVYAAIFQILWQIKTVNLNSADDCMKKFKSNLITAILILLAIII